MQRIVCLQPSTACSSDAAACQEAGLAVLMLAVPDCDMFLRSLKRRPEISSGQSYTILRSHAIILYYNMIL